jgi:hypothetical protein
MATTWFGGTTSDTDSIMGAHAVSGQSFAAPISGNITQARGSLGSNTANAGVKVLIYAVSAGAPGALLGQSDELLLVHPAAITLRTFTFSTPVAVVSGTSYFLVIYGGPAPGWKHRRDSAAGTTHSRATGLLYPTAPNPFGTDTTFGGFRLYLEAGIDTVSVPAADFTGTPTSGTEPLSVAFTDASTNTPTSWAWTFGDGGTSTSQNPTHSYAAAGTYTVALVATNSSGSDTKTRTGYITVADQPRPIRINTSQGWADIGDATSFVSGTGAPTAAVGATGAVYLDTATGRVYGPKAGGAWPGTSIGRLLIPGNTYADVAASYTNYARLLAG